MKPSVGSVVLAAGGSQRLGKPKQLVRHHGQSLVRIAVESACLSQVGRCAVVVGAQAAAIADELGGLSVEILCNPDWPEGMASSIRAGVAWAAAAGCEALLITLCDQPSLTAAHLNQLVDCYLRTGLAVGSRYAGKNAVPALFPRASFEALSALRGDHGASALLNGADPVIAVPWVGGEFDVDTPEAEQRLVGDYLE